MEDYSLSPRLYGYSNSYNAEKDASVSNAFATAAFRFGHTLVASFVQ